MEPIKDNSIQPIDKTLNDIISGRFEYNCLPSLNPRLIRLFICAPSDDTFTEVSYLNRHVFPKLREFTLSRYGFEFQAVDLFWGINNQIKTNYESLLSICIKELEKCRLNSIGITFLSLLGNVYGPIDLPDWIERNKFEAILQCLKESNLDVKLLDKFYCLNINYLSNRYEIIHKDYITNDIKNSLTQTLINGTKLAVDKNLIEKSFLSDIDSSILEKLVTKGIVNSESKIDRVFSFVRLLTNISDSDVKMDSLRNKKLNYSCPAEQIYRIKMNKIDDNYLKNFGEHYLKVFENIIEKSVQQNPETKYPSPYDDILNHYDYIRSKNLNLISTYDEFIMKSLRDYVFNERNTKPLILFGPNGSGKTTYISMMASNLYFQFVASSRLLNNSENNYSLVLRFIGIDEKSFYLRNLLKSVCLQMNLILNKPTNKVPEKLSDLKLYFKNLLTQNQSIKLIVMLDSLECLSDKDSSFKLDWLPDYLNFNCKLILSLSSECGELVERFKRKYPDQNDYLRMRSLTVDETNYVLRKHLAQNNYRLEKEQYDLVLNLVEKMDIILPLHLALITEEILAWKSYNKIDECILKINIKESLHYFIDRLKQRHGNRLVKHVLSYITISKTGLSELELQDILSLDNELLKEFKSKDLINFSSYVIRLPFVYLSKILDELKQYLIIRPFHGVYTIYWKHKIFAEIIFEKYLKANKAFDEYLHKNLAEYYLGTWSNSKLKPLVYEITVSSKVLDPDCLFDKLIFQVHNIEADRLVPSQPLEYTHFHTHIKPRYNLRKLSLLPYHLYKANMINELLKEVYFNIDWLYLKIKVFDLKQLLNDFDLYKKDNETNIICECLKMAEQAIAENSDFLFGELSGRLVPFYDMYPNLKRLVDQCDAMSLKLLPLLPIGQTFNSPSWILRDNLPVQMKVNDVIDIEILESDFNGHILMAKNYKSNLAKFIDLDLLEEMNQISVGEGKCHCSKNGDFFCMVEDNCRLIIRRIATGDFYTHGIVEFEQNEIGRIFTSTNYAAITFRKSSSPLLIDLNLSQIVEVFPYSTNFCSFSPDDKVILIHSEKSLNYFFLNGSAGAKRKFCLSSLEIPEVIVFANNNRKIFSLFKDTKQIFYYKLNLEKNFHTSDYILQDRDITDMKTTLDESRLLVCSLTCVYVLEISVDDVHVIHKLKANTLDIMNSDNKLNVFNGFGVTLDNKIVYATIYSYLICYDMETGSVLRIFQSSLSASRILKSCSSRRSDMMISFLNDGSLILWNLASLQANTMKFDDMRVHSDHIVNILLPEIPNDSPNNACLALSFCDVSPDVKVHSLSDRFNVRSIVNESYNELLDNPLTIHVKVCVIDEAATYCFIATSVADFKGKQLPHEKNFAKLNCCIIDLINKSRLMHSFSYIVKNDSRFEINAQFIKQPQTESTFLLFKLTSCINDFDPYCKKGLDWSEFETLIKIFGPIKSNLTRIETFDEFKFFGECLSDAFLTSQSIYGCLMQECHKLADKQNPTLIIAKRFEVRLNLYNIFESKINSLPVIQISLNELLTSEQFYYRNVLLDTRSLKNGLLLVIYSKQGAVSADQIVSDVSLISKFDYNYETLRFNRNICTNKAAFLFDPSENQIKKHFPNIFSKTTNVEQIIVSACGLFILDNNWDLYDLSKNNIKLMRRLARPDLDLDLKWARFILNARYLICSNTIRNKVHLIRCYDSIEVASFRLDRDQLTCLKVGELDRTIMLGTQNGCVLPLRLLIDLEFNDAIKKFNSFYRNIKTKLNNTALNNDIKKLRHSAHAHLKLKANESNRLQSTKLDMSTTRPSSSMCSYNSDTVNHNGIQKSNLVNLTAGIRHSNNATMTRACILQ